MAETDEYRLRQEIVRIGQLMYEKGFICASDGNISARLGPDRILITPSGLHKGLLEPEQLLVVDENGRLLPSLSYANRHLKPTSELPMHLEAYRQRPDIQAVVHAHPPITVALSIAGIPLADCLLPEVIVFLGLIPTTQYATPSSTENVRAIRDLIQGHDAIVLQRHGTLTVGNSPMQAFMRLETVEQNARIALILAQLGVRNPLPPEEVRKLLRQRQAMGLARPGETAEFCAVCGVCHPGDEHAPTLRPSTASTSPSASANPELVRSLVAQIVHKTLGQ
ncbi:MAG: class II aldolase/adducin family protein [Chloroflexi bacterium]|nr:MAG: class II aldolase/adducin family protein [Chloroflexota bacterium]